MDSEAGDFQRSGYLSAQQAELLRSKVDELLTIIRPQAVPLVESFKLPDYLLNSALGRSDGGAYEALFDFAIRERTLSVLWFPGTQAHSLLPVSSQWHCFQCRLPFHRNWHRRTSTCQTLRSEDETFTTLKLVVWELSHTVYAVVTMYRYLNSKCLGVFAEGLFTSSSLRARI